MQKKLIAMAIAGMIAAPAFAQSNVTVYGIIDTFVGYGKAGDNKFSGLGDGVLSGSRLGFKGSEDLGNGLKAMFTLEQGFASDTAAANDSSKQFHRQAWVGLEGGFGFIGLGRQYAPGYFTFRNDAVSAGALDPRAILGGKVTSTGLGADVPAFKITAGSQQRWDNSVVYQSKSMGGFSARVAYGFDAVETSTKTPNVDKGDDDNIGLGLNYANGPLNVDYVYVDDGAAAGDQKEHYLGAAYNFGSFTLVGSYQTADLENVGEAKMYQIGGIVAVGNGNIHVAYAHRTNDPDGVSNADADAASFTVAYTHNLSKRTTAYAGINRTTNDDNVGYGSLAKQEGKGSTGFGVGIRHTF